MARKPSRKTLIKKADAVFSEYIRRRYADHKGYTNCVTCGKKDHWKNLQCGHFQSRKHYSTRWNETNCQVQCVSCNVYHYGEQFKFGKYIDTNYGTGTADKLHLESRKITKYSDVELLELINFYQKKLAEIK